MMNSSAAPEVTPLACPLPVKTAMIRVMIVEDHPMVRETLGRIIEREGDMEVCGSADNVQDAMRQIVAVRPDVALVDISLRESNGLDLIKNLRAQGIDMPTIVLSIHDEALYAERAFRAGASGYISKTEEPTTVITAIRRVLAGQMHASQTFTSHLLRKLAEKERLGRTSVGRSD